MTDKPSVPTPLWPELPALLKSQNIIEPAQQIIIIKLFNAFGITDARSFAALNQVDDFKSLIDYRFPVGDANSTWPDARLGPLRKLQVVSAEIQCGVAHSRPLNSLTFEISREFQTDKSDKDNFYYWTWIMYYTGCDGKERATTGHSRVQNPKNYYDEIREGRKISTEEAYKPLGENSTILLQLPYGEKSQMQIDLHLWRHRTKDSTFQIKNTFSDATLNTLEDITKKNVENKQKAANDVFNSFTTTVPKLASAVPVPGVPTAVNLSVDSIGLFRNSVKFLAASVANDTLCQRQSLHVDISRGWDGVYALNVFRFKKNCHVTAFPPTDNDPNQFLISNLKFNSVEADVTITLNKKHPVASSLSSSAASDEITTATTTATSTSTIGKLRGSLHDLVHKHDAPKNDGENTGMY